MSQKNILDITKQKPPYIKIEIDSDYNNFHDFYENNKDFIYKNIIEVYRGLTKSRKKSLNLLIITKIDGDDWGTEFIFRKNERDVLINDILNHFEKNEEYEICSEIIKINEILEKKKN